MIIKERTKDSISSVLSFFIVFESCFLARVSRLLLLSLLVFHTILFVISTGLVLAGFNFAVAKVIGKG